MSEAQFDVAAIEIKRGKVLWVMGPSDADNADAIICMAIARQGVEDRFFGTCQSGQYKEGDKWTGGVPLPEHEFSPRGKRGL